MYNRRSRTFQRAGSLAVAVSMGFATGGVAGAPWPAGAAAAPAALEIAVRGPAAAAGLNAAGVPARWGLRLSPGSAEAVVSASDAVAAPATAGGVRGAVAGPGAGAAGAVQGGDGLGGITPEQLKAALLSPADLPAGYRPVGKPAVADGEKLPANGLGISVGASGCDVTIEPAEPPADRSAGAARGSGPVVPAVVGPDEVPHAAVAVFSKGKAGPIVVEMLVSGTAESARGMVAAFAEQSRRCPRITVGVAGEDERIVMKQSPLRMPAVGDASAAVSLSVAVPGAAGAEPGTMVTFAEGRVAGTVVYSGAGDEYLTVVRAAARKLRALRDRD